MIKYINEAPNIKDYWPLFMSTGWNEIFNMDKETVAKSILASSFAVSAYHEDQLVGFARAISDKVMYAAIYDVMVLPDYQKQGIGKKLVENITMQCKEAGVYSMHLFAADGTESFYNQMGYHARPANMPGMRYEPTNLIK